MLLPNNVDSPVFHGALVSSERYMYKNLDAFKTQVPLFLFSVAFEMEGEKILFCSHLSMGSGVV